MTLIHALCALQALTILHNPSSEPWDTIWKKTNMTIQSRGVTNSDIREIRVDAIFPVKAARLWAVLDNLEHYTDFMPYLHKAHRLTKRIVSVDTNTKTRTSNWVEYQILQAPLIDDRDLVLKMVVTANKERQEYTRQWSCEPSAPHAPPVPPNTIRIELCWGKWKFRPVTNKEEHTQVEYQLYTEPGGNIPTWIINKLNKTSPKKLLKAIRKRSENPNWTR